MNDLLTTVIDVHGGMKRWNQLQTVSARLDLGGALFGLKGYPGFGDVNNPVYITADLHRENASHYPFLKPDWHTVFEANRIAIESKDGTVIQERHNPRNSFNGHGLETPWDELQLAYFCGYAMWTYFTSPFVFAKPGFEIEEVESLIENNETWRALKVKFPATIATHSSVQTFYFDEKGFLKRHDYEVDVIGGIKAAHYVHDYREVDGIMLPFNRRVYPVGPNNEPMAEPLVVAIDLADVTFK